MILPYSDIHTHVPAPDAVVNYDPSANSAPLSPELVYSVGIHPWRVLDCTPADLEHLAILAARPEVVAIGETGFDVLHPAGIPREELIRLQAELFRRHIGLSEQFGKPLVIHCVKAWEELLREHRLATPSQPWIVHGFRGNATLARQLLDAGLYLSFGSRYNPEAFKITPPDRRFRESDTMPE